MSSISKEELLVCLESYPNDAEVIMEIHERDQNGNPKHSIAYINAVGYDEEWNEIRLMN